MIGAVIGVTLSGYSVHNIRKRMGGPPADIGDLALSVLALVAIFVVLALLVIAVLEYCKRGGD